MLIQKKTLPVFQQKPMSLRTLELKYCSNEPTTKRLHSSYCSSLNECLHCIIKHYVQMLSNGNQCPHGPMNRNVFPMHEWIEIWFQWTDNYYKFSVHKCFPWRKSERRTSWHSDNHVRDLSSNKISPGGVFKLPPPTDPNISLSNQRQLNTFSQNVHKKFLTNEASWKMKNILLMKLWLSVNAIHKLCNEEI